MKYRNTNLFAFEASFILSLDCTSVLAYYRYSTTNDPNTNDCFGFKVSVKIYKHWGTVGVVTGLGNGYSYSFRQGCHLGPYLGKKWL